MSLWRSVYGASTNATAAEASYWLCRHQPLMADAATYTHSPKPAMSHLPISVLERLR